MQFPRKTLACLVHFLSHGALEAGAHATIGSRCDSSLRLRHQVCVKIQIVFGQSPRRKDLTRLIKMTQVGSCIAATSPASASFIQGPAVARMAGLLNRDPASGGKGTTVASVAGGHHAVE